MTSSLSPNTPASPACKLAVVVCATKNYTYAMAAQARRVAANIEAAKYPPVDGRIILVGDGSYELKQIERLYEQLLPAMVTERIVLDIPTDEHENYKVDAQMLIARMRETAHAAARGWGADYCWSLDSDVLPPHNALRSMLDMLRFDNGYYSVSTCPYPNTAFLGGFGSYQNQIAEDFLPHERKLTDELKARIEAEKKERAELTVHPTEEQQARWAETHKLIKECPPDGNIWEVTAKHGWRRRGWLDNAYPAIGQGAVVPSDWCGFGCTLMNREALALATFEGYEGKGTEDLFICWERWHPAGIRINVIPHCPCDHVIWDRKKKGGDAAKFTHYVTYHEREGECRGHLRVRTVPWVNR